MKMTAIGRAALEAREGVRLVSYRDSVGVWTIGVGHTAACGAPIPGPGVKINAAEADAAFARDLARFENGVTNAIRVPLGDHEFDALTSIAFNIGVGWFGVGGHQVATFVKLLNAGDRAGCAAHIMDFVKPPELLGRRTAERDQFLTPYAVAMPRPTKGQAPIKAPASQAPPPLVTTTSAQPPASKPASSGLFSWLHAALSRIPA